MSHLTLTAVVEDWLLRKALSDPDISSLFERLCDRLRGIGLPLDRAALSWPTLHPLFRAEMAFWYPDKGAELEQYYHSQEGSESWTKSPFAHLARRQLSTIRRHLTGPDAVLDFEVLRSFRDSGYTDYLLTSTPFQIAETKGLPGFSSGIMASWMTRRDHGFTDADIEALERIQTVFAIACRASIQRRVMANIAEAYLGPTAGHRVLSGAIKRGDGARIPAVVWFSDLRDSTRLSDTMDAESYLALLNRYFECTAQPVIDNGGEILNFIGDGVLAIFPISEDCPKAAAASAETAARQALEHMRTAEREGTPASAPLRFGIGLAVGEVTFGNIGVRNRLSFSGVGKVVNTVHRVEAATKDLDTPVLALESFAKAAPGTWERAGETVIPDFDRSVDLFTFADALPAVRKRAAGARIPAK